MAFEGMDVDEVDRLAGKLKIQADAVTAIVGVVDSAVSGLAGVWSGDDLNAFHAVWTQTHRPRATSLSGQLDGWVTELRQQVAQQRAASGEGAVSGGPSLLPGLGRSLHGLRGAFTAELAREGHELDSFMNFVTGVDDNPIHAIPDILEGGVSAGLGWNLYRQVGKGLSGKEFDEIASGKFLPSPVFKVADKVLGGAALGVAVGQTAQAAAHHDMGGVVLHGTEALLDAGSFVPGPIGLGCKTASVLLSVGELAYDNRKQIGAFANTAAHADADVAKATASAVSSGWHHLFG